MLATLRSLAPPRRVEIGDRLRLSPQPLDKSEEATLAEATDGLTIHDGVENMATDQAKRMSRKNWRATPLGCEPVSLSEQELVPTSVNQLL